MNQRTFLGLTHNPFEPPRTGFYPGADRKTHLEHLRHLSQWSRRILAVTGPVGVGKSSLFKELSNSLESGVRGARISGSVVTSERQVIIALLQGFGIAADADAHLDALCELVTQHVSDQAAGNVTCMAMVDDAQALDSAALQRLVGLVGTSALRLVVFAETSVVQSLDRVARAAEVDWFEIRLTGFPKADVRDYLEWRFRQAEYRGRLPFTEEQVEKIAAKSAGNPGLIDAMASRLLSQMESGEFRKRQGFPTSHLTLALLLAVAVGLTYLYLSDAPAEPEEVAVQIEQVELPDQTEPDPVLSDAPAAEPDEVEARVQAEDANEGNEAAAEIAEAETDGVSDAMPEESAAAPQKIEQGQEAALPQTPVPVMDQSEPEAEEAEVEETEQAVVPIVESEPEPAPEPQTPATATAYKTPEWLLRQNPDYYTLQLLSLSTAERARGFVARQSDPEEFVIYTMRRDDRTLHVITYGVYSSRAAAERAAGNLQGEMGRINAWIRPIRLVQDTIRNYGQGN